MFRANASGILSELTRLRTLDTVIVMIIDEIQLRCTASAPGSLDRMMERFFAIQTQVHLHSA